jgi:hypothetical protein
MPFIERKATLAQLVERLIRNQQVASSILAGGSIFSNSYRLLNYFVVSVCGGNCGDHSPSCQSEGSDRFPLCLHPNV